MITGRAWSRRKRGFKHCLGFWEGWAGAMRGFCGIRGAYFHQHKWCLLGRHLRTGEDGVFGWGNHTNSYVVCHCNVGARDKTHL